MFEGFDRTRIDEQIEKYHDEAVERWGREKVERSETRVRGMSQQDWDAIGQESNEINSGLAALMDSHAPGTPEVQVLIDRWYRLLNRHFAEYTPEVFRGLGNLYVEDSRFTATYDEIRPGLASFLRDGMHVWADRAEGQGS
jgi:MerR family transcriptional regulator, multidrug-efflux activator